LRGNAKRTAVKTGNRQALAYGEVKISGVIKRETVPFS